MGRSVRKRGRSTMHAASCGISFADNVALQTHLVQRAGPIIGSRNVMEIRGRLMKRLTRKAIQPRATSLRAVESCLLRDELATSSPRMARPVVRRIWPLALLAAAWLTVNFVQAQEKIRRSERRSRRSQASAEADSKRDTAPINPSAVNPSESEVEQQKTDAAPSALSLRDVINFAAGSRDAVKDVKD